MAYQGNQINYNNLNTELKNKIDKTEEINVIKDKVDNSWQKGVYNDTDIMNLSSASISRVFYINDWTAPANNIEQASIVIPVENFNGTVKVSVAGNFNTTNGSGAFEYENSYLKVGDTVHTNKRTIYKADENIASQYYFLGFNKSESLFTIPIVRAPHALNRVTVKVEILTTFASFEPLKNAYVVYEDFGTSWHGYPWTPQRSQIPTASEIAFWNVGMWDDIVNGRDFPVNGVPTNLSLLKPAQFRDLLNNVLPRRTGTFKCFINTSDVGAPSINSYGILTTIKPWLDESGGGLTQKLEAADVIHKRFQVDEDTWSPWVRMQDSSVDVLKLFQSASDVKTNVAQAITDKGVPTSPDAIGAQMAANIRAIQTHQYWSNNVDAQPGASSFQLAGGSSYVYMSVCTVTIPFRPKILYAQSINGYDNYTTTCTELSDTFGSYNYKVASYGGLQNQMIISHLKANYTQSGNNYTFNIPVSVGNRVYTIIAT